MKPSTFIFIIIALLTLALLSYLFIPVVRYYLIPLTGGTKAPQFAQAPSATKERLFVPGTLANKTEVVSTIAQVPVEGGWINTAPLDLKELQQQGKFILIDFWTYTCINCIRATPYTQELWERYKDHGLVVIGVHSPEFAVEKDPKNIFTAIKKAGITYPVLTDGNMKVWREFGNHFWPGKYLINPAGIVIYTQFGEGNYEHEEEVIRTQLEKAGHSLPDYGPTTKFLEPVSKDVTPELYAGPGFIRKPYGNKERPEINKVVTFTLPSTLQRDAIYLDGSWLGMHDYVESKSNGKIVLKYLANAPYIVLDAPDKELELEVLLNNQPIPQQLRGKDSIERNGKTVMRINEPRLYYPIADTAPYEENTITFITPAGLRFYAFTFGAY